MKFVIHREGVENGPWSYSEVLENIQQKILEWTDYVYDEQQKDWVFLMDHPVFAEKFKSLQSQSQPAVLNENKAEHGETDWYVLRNENKYGPFTYVEVLKMLQERKLFEFDFVWNRPYMNSWQRISEVPDFQPDRIKAIKQAGGAMLSDVFYRRRHARARFGASVLVHNNKEVWRGNSIEISAGGAGLVLETDQLQIGVSVFLHFKAGDGVPPFNAVCSIVSKQDLKDGTYRYGVKFSSISQSVQQAIKKLTSRAA